MKVRKEIVNKWLIVSAVCLFFGVYGYVMLAFLHPLPHITPNRIGNSIFTADQLPGNCRVIGIDITADDRIYLYAEHQTLCFDHNGEYLGRFVYYAQGGTFFKLSDDPDGFWVFYYRGLKKYFCDHNGVVLREETAQRNELSGEYRLIAADAMGNEYRVQKFLCFSWVKGPDGRTFYKQSGTVIASLVFVIISAVSTAVFLILRFMQGDLYLDHGLIMKRQEQKTEDREDTEAKNEEMP